LAPTAHSLDKFTGVAGIAQQQAAELCRITLRDTGANAHDRRHAAANRLVNVQPIGLVADRTHEHVGCGQYFVNPLREAQHPDPVRKAGSFDAMRPAFNAAASAGDYQIDVPPWIGA
jgi:hypothetical protein